jgi:hypothetical protein
MEQIEGNTHRKLIYDFYRLSPDERIKLCVHLNLIDEKSADKIPLVVFSMALERAESMGFSDDLLIKIIEQLRDSNERRNQENQQHIPGG